MKNVQCFILSYEITKGMKSYGPLGLLKHSDNSKELILYQIECLNKIFIKPSINIVSGFGNEKLYKKLHKNIGRLYNDKFETANHGYAIKLILSNFDYNKYDGLFVMDHGVLLKGLGNAPLPSLKSSWVFNRKTKKHDTKNKYIGSVMDSDGLLDYIFYDIGPLAWCNSVYLCKKDIIKLKSSIDTFYDNMFLFEIINKSISSNTIKYHSFVMPNDSFIMISGIKDKNKIKETI